MYANDGSGRCGGIAIAALKLAVLIRAAGDVLLYAYLPIYLYAHLGEERLWVIGLLPAVPGAARFVAAPFWGRQADRLARQRPFLVGGLAAYAALMLLLPRVTASLQAVALVAAASAFTCAFNPVARVWWTLRAPGRAVLDLAGWYRAEAAGFLGGSALLGWAAGSGAAALAAWMWSMGALFAAAAVWVAWAVPDAPRREGWGGGGSGGGPRGSSRAGSRIAGRGPAPSPMRAAAPVLGFVLLASLTWEAVAATYGVYVTQELGVPAPLYGLTIGASTAVNLWAYGPLAAAAERRGGGPLFLWSALGYAAMYLLMATRSPWAASLAYLVPMSAVLRTATNAWLAARVPEGARGRASGLLDAAEACAAMLGAFLGGVAAHRLGLAFVPRAALAGSLPLLLILAWARVRGRRAL
ncbi:MAG: hypothetical protein IMW98_08070 [Firmicutes bacterium]|nr:hypothetical protein [Bacillota bacterium]